MSMSLVAFDPHRFATPATSWRPGANCAALNAWTTCRAMISFVIQLCMMWTYHRQMSLVHDGGRSDKTDVGDEYRLSHTYAWIGP